MHSLSPVFPPSLSTHQYVQQTISWKPMRIDSLTLRFVGEQEVFDSPGLNSDSWIKHLLIAVNPQQHKQQQNRQASTLYESCITCWPLWKTKGQLNLEINSPLGMCKTTYLQNQLVEHKIWSFETIFLLFLSTQWLSVAYKQHWSSLTLIIWN